MRHASLPAFLSSHHQILAKEPVALLLGEDGVEVASSFHQAFDRGFRAVVLLPAPPCRRPKRTSHAPTSRPTPFSPTGRRRAR